MPAGIPIYVILCWVFLVFFLGLADLILILPEWFARFDPWTVAVTDRRVLVRKRLFSKHYADIHLSDIRQIDHDWQSGKLTLVGPEHAVEIRCNEREAAIILKALKGAYEPPRSFWRRLWGRR
jgi:hypothetical protein